MIALFKKFLVLPIHDDVATGIQDEDPAFHLGHFSDLALSRLIC